MQIYKKIKAFISLVCALAILLSVFITPVVAGDGYTVTATTNSSVKQGYSADCYVNIDSTRSLAALEVTVHFDPAKVKINNVYNSVDCVLYDSAINTDSIQFSYILSGTGSGSQTRLFRFNYQVLGNAEIGDTYFDITIGEAYDSALNDVAVSGSRCKFTVAETVTNKSCSVSSTRSLNTSIEQEFSLSYRLSSYEIASGSAVVSYDPELFQVVEVTNGAFLNNKLTDINTELAGAVYISFVGTAYNTKYDFFTIKFKTLKNTDEASPITLKITELCDKNLNIVSCNDFVTTANIVFDSTYSENAPKMSVSAYYNETQEKVTAVITLEENSRLGAGDFVLEFDPELLSFSSYEKGFSPSFFNVSTKDAAEGKIKLHIISLEDITQAQTVLTVVFDSLADCGDPRTELDVEGSMLTDSLTEPILLNFIGCEIVFSKEHTYGSWTLTSSPTCDKDGVLTKTCSTCGDVVTDKLNALGHNYSADWVVDIAPTCTAAGSKSHHCTVCGNKADVTEIEATGHSYSDWAVSKEPGCVSLGSKYKVCANCQGVVTETVEPIGHAYETEWTIDVPAACTTNGSKSRHCLRCSDKIDVTVIEAIGHNYSEWITDVEPDCVSAGSKHKTCESCQNIVKETIKATGHSYSDEWIIDVPATCTTNGSKSYHCTVCDAKTGVTTILAAHDFESFTTVDIERTCTKNGEISRHCKNCSARTDIIKTTALGHKYENYTVVEAATCTEDGYAISSCINCGDIKNHTVYATGHLFSNVWTIDEPATCTTTGSKSRRCIYCGEKKDVTPIAMIGHTYVWTDDFEQGVSTGVCENCGDIQTETINIDAILTFKLNSAGTGYIVSDCIAEAVGRIGIPATYNDLPVLEIGGSAFKDCLGITSIAIPEGVTKIGNQAFMGCTSLVSASVPSTALTWGTAVFRNCTALTDVNLPEGITSVSGATFYGCTSLEEIAIPHGVTSLAGSCFRDCSSLARVEIPHSVSSVVNYSFAGCTALGEVIYRGDEESWATISMGSNNTTLTSALVIYADFTHTVSDDAVIVEPTCVSEGCEIYSCVYCDKEFYEIIAPTGIHDYEADWTVDITSTCQQEGSKSRHCKYCEAKTDVTSVPKAHVFSSEWTIDIPATCQQEGSKSRHCNNCDEKTDVTVIAKAHIYSTEWTVDVEPGCTENGSKSHHCTLCNDKKDVTVILPIGHNYEYTDTLNVHPHTVTYTCSNCGDEQFDDGYTPECIECNYVVSYSSQYGYKLLAYVSDATEIVVPSIHNDKKVVAIGNSCYRGYNSLTSIVICDGITTIGSLAFMECNSLERIVIPASVTSIGANAFYGFTGVIYCTSGSYAHAYAVENNIRYVLEDVGEDEAPICEKDGTRIDYERCVIRTQVYTCHDIADILELSDSAVVIARASYTYGELELYGTGTIITVFNGNEYVGDFILIVDGDVNGDSVCDVLDAMQVARASSGTDNLYNEYAMAADTNGDDYIDVADYQAIINKVVA